MSAARLVHADDTGNHDDRAAAEAVANVQIAERLRMAASLLTAQGANPFRAGAYLRAADSVMRLDDDVTRIFESGGYAALESIPGVGHTIAGAIAEMLGTGRWSFLDGLKGAMDPVTLFRCVPGIGPRLAGRIHTALHLDTLEALEAAAHDGRLAGVPGIGPRRAAIVRGALAELLPRLRPARRQPLEEPDIRLLLDVDREYREKAAAGLLRKIAPKRFNPGSEAWLPVLHTARGIWHFTALFSNTALAHRLGRTADWVVIFFAHDSGPDGRRTVVTETSGPARGRRVVRGREAECLASAAADA